MTKKTIMITRPAHQAGPITEKLKAAGANTFLFPTLEIAPADPDTKSQRQFHQFDIIIFISSNAIEYGLSHIQTLPPLPDTLQFATIGKASANTFKNIFGKQADIVPTENFNSEGLLATEAMQKVANKHILIIRGNGGREYLKNALEKRGAHVEYFTAYQRLKPNTNTSDFEQYLQNNAIAAIVITSVESLKNLIKMTPNNVSKKILQIPLVLINVRLKAIAIDAGFTSDIFIAQQASDDAIIEVLKKHTLF